MFDKWMQAEKFRKIPPIFLRYGIRQINGFIFKKGQIMKPSRISYVEERYRLLKNLRL